MSCNQCVSGYIVLNSSPETEPNNLKKNYRELVKKWHPDCYEHDPVMRAAAGLKLTAINVAYNHISSCRRYSADVNSFSSWDDSSTYQNYGIWERQSFQEILEDFLYSQRTKQCTGFTWCSHSLLIKCTRCKILYKMFKVAHFFVGLSATIFVSCWIFYDTVEDVYLWFINL